MADNSKIEWTGSTWTPIRAVYGPPAAEQIGWHCVHVSEGCRNCYAAEKINLRLGTRRPFKPSERVRLFLDAAMLLRPLSWRKPRRIFVCSMTDLFADFVQDEWIARIFAIAALSPDRPATELCFAPTTADTNRVGMMRRAARIPRTLPQHQRRPDPRRAEDHRVWIKTLPCLACGRRPPSDPAHLRFNEGHDIYKGAMGKRPPDELLISLCRSCHDKEENQGKADFLGPVPGGRYFRPDRGCSPTASDQRRHRARVSGDRARPARPAHSATERRPMTGGYWLLWTDAGHPVWHQIFHVSAYLCRWWSMDAGGFVIGWCPY